MYKIRIAKVVFDKKIGNSLLSSVQSHWKNWERPLDFHVTCAFMHRDSSSEDKFDVIDWCEHLLREDRKQVTIGVDGIYKSKGNIFTKINYSSVEGPWHTCLPKPEDQILHMTLLVDRQNGFLPKDSLFALRSGEYEKIGDCKDEFFNGELKIQNIT